MSQQLEMYMYCFMNKQYVEGMKKVYLTRKNKIVTCGLPFPGRVQVSLFC